MKLLTGRVILLASLALAISALMSWKAIEASSAKTPVAAMQDGAEESVSAARQALEQALSEKGFRFKKRSISEVAKAFRAYQAAVARRQAEIYERLKQLDYFIAEPPSTSPIDDPAQSSHLHPRPEVSVFVEEYDSHRRELSELNRDLKSLTDKVNPILGAQGAQCPPLTTINGIMGSGSPDFPSTIGQQTGRLLNGLGNVNCGSSNPCSLNTTVGLRAFDAYTFINPGSTTACVTVNFTMTGCNLGQAMQFSARLGSFDPANPCANYVGDGGAGFSGEVENSFSFNVPAGEIFVIVVNENDPGGATGCAYSLTISGISCQPVCPPDIITGTIGQGSKDYPSTSDVQTGRVSQNGINSSCEAPKTCPGIASAGSPFTFDAYEFVNDSSSSSCVTFTFPPSCGPNNAIHPVAYLGSFDPANPCANYLGDIGNSINTTDGGEFSVNVPANSTVVLVVHENGAVPGCLDYSFSVSGLPCQSPCVITCPSNITQPNDPDQCGAVVNYSAPTVSGDCGTVECNPPSGSFFPLGTTSVTCATSQGENCAFTVTVNQAEPPTINCPSNLTAVAPATCNQNGSAIVNFPAPAASDSCGSVITVCSPASGSTFPLGTTTVTCTATSAGGSSACTFTVTVFGGCLQDDSNPGNVVLFNTATGDYRFCCNGVVIAEGIGTVTKKGCEFTIQHNRTDRRVLIKPSFSSGKGTASIQSPPGILKCSIMDRNIFDNTCQCGGV